MLKLLFEFCTYTLAGYGAFCLLVSFLKHIQYKTSLKGHKISLVLLVKNAEEIIEGIVRSIFIEGIIGRLIPAENFFVIDMGSSDKTGEILCRLEKEYAAMEVVDEDGKDKIFQPFHVNEIKI